MGSGNTYKQGKISRRTFLHSCAGAIAGIGIFGICSHLESEFGLQDVYGLENDAFQEKSSSSVLRDAPALPANNTSFKTLGLEGVRTRIGIMSDTHVSDSEPIAIGNCEMALETMYAATPGISDFFVLGDVTSYGYDEELETFASRMGDQLSYYYPDGPAMHLIMGNHDFRYSSEENFEALFSNHHYSSLFPAQQNSVEIINGATVIKLNGIAGEVIDYTISYDFLASALEEASTNRPEDAILVMSHQSPENIDLLENSESGYFGQGTSYDLVELMQRYPQVRMFSGHVHNNMNREGSINADLGFSSIHTSTIGSYLYYKNELENGEEVGCQCVVLDIMEDGRLLAHCLDFYAGDYICESVEI